MRKRLNDLGVRMSLLGIDFKMGSSIPTISLIIQNAVLIKEIWLAKDNSLLV